MPFSNPYHFPKRTICVIRDCGGHPRALKILGDWREWAGAFSIWEPCK